MFPGACIIKLITAVIYGFRNKLECLSLGKPFQPSLVFRDKHLLITETVNYVRNKFYDTGPRWHYRVAKIANIFTKKYLTISVNL